VSNKFSSGEPREASWLGRDSLASGSQGGDWCGLRMDMGRAPDRSGTGVGETAAAIFEAIADPIFVIDFVEDGLGEHFRYVNEAACRLLQRSREELQAMRPGTVDEIDAPVMDETYERLVTEGRATFETMMIAADGSRIPMEIHASDATLDGRRICIAVARSLVARKELDRQMRAAKEAAEAANRAKSEFLATMSHEIRTPLHGVIGFASLLEGSKVPPRMQEAISGIRDSANLLLALVTDVLDFSRIEAGLLELQPAPLDPGAQLRRIATAFALRAREKGLAFHYTEDPLLPSAVLADELRIEQVLGNLLGNALKFTERGSISLNVESRVFGEPARCEITFLVSDTGIGIREEKLPRLFNPFSQADATPTRRHGGSGLGLVIVKKLCELMDGVVSVQSEFGRGSIFTASLIAPVAAGAEAPGRPASQPGDDGRLRDLQILVAEDYALNQKLMSRMIERLGGAADFASDGLEAVEMAKRGRYDLIFMDVSMPEISGLDATRGIRTFERAEGRAPAWIIALTAGVSDGERQACAEAGMDDFLGKPFNEQSLAEAMKRGQASRRPEQ